MKKTLLVDIGRVLLDFHFEKSLVQLWAGQDVSQEWMADRMLALWPDRDRFERGEMSVMEFVRRAQEVLACGRSDQELIEIWRDIFSPIERMWNLMEEVRELGVRLVLFSNTNALHCPWIFEKYPKFALFEDAILSYEVGAMKPALGMYQLAIERYGQEGGEIGYVDDIKENVEMGEKMGFVCHQYDQRQHDQFEHWLQKWLKR